MKNQNLTLVDKELLIVLIKSGMTPEEARSFVLGGNTTEDKKADTKLSKSKDLDKKSKSRKSTSKVATKKSNDNIEIGDYFRNFAKSKPSKTTAVGKVASFKDDEGLGKIVVSTTKRQFLLKNCEKISETDFGKLKKKLAKSEKKATKVASNKSKRLGEYEYTLVYTKIASDQEPSLKDLHDLALKTDKSDLKTLADIRENVKKSLPDFKLDAKTACAKFAEFSNKINANA